MLTPLTPQSLADEDFPYMSLREITVGDVPVRALRVTYVGELGWELYCPTEYGLGLWRALWEEGRPHGLIGGGYRAIDSLRLEKGYRVWGADITPDETPYEGGLGFCVKLDKEGGFIGREALVEAAERGPRASLCCLTLEDPRSVALGNEPVRVGGAVAGRVTTGGYGYTVERSIAYAYLPPERARPGPRSRWRSSGAGSPARSRPSRSSIRTGGGFAQGIGVGGLGHQPGQDVLGALDMSAHEPDSAAGVALSEQAHEAPVLGVRAGEHLIGMRDAGNQVAHLPLHLGHGGHETRGMRGLREADVEAHVGAPVLLERSGGGTHPLGERVEVVEVGRRGPLGGQDRGARLHRHPVVEGTRALPRPTRHRRVSAPSEALRPRTCPRRARAARSGARSGRAWSAPAAGWTARSSADPPGRARRGGGHPG